MTLLLRWEAVYSSDEEGEAGGAETGAVRGAGGDSIMIYSLGDDK